MDTTQLIIFYATIFILSYLFGSIPWAFIIGKANGVDIRKCGSGNVGATNVTRTVGKCWGKLCFACDLLKGVLPVVTVSLIAKKYLPSTTESTINYGCMVAGFSAISGHVWTIFLKFKGGKGISTSAGVLLALAPAPVLAALILWVIIFKTSKMVSLASIIAAGALPIIAVIFNYTLKKYSFFATEKPILIFLVVIAVIAIAKHRSNIKRIIAGTESKFR
ncbi:glycerol-3-phosphate 1-O-acyltransferase PlsY [Lentisphaerota bacterium WC36G]|nr:glycerol-3-phosphate 1-O-acyltransferase PlsY [Lentisphaerae bacterium WC36]